MNLCFIARNLEYIGVVTRVIRKFIQFGHLIHILGQSQDLNLKEIKV
jgi:hypothetical protein